ARRLETNGNGILAGKSAVVIGEDEKSYIVYLSRNDFYATNGQDPVRIGLKISTYIQSQSEASLVNACAIHHKRDNLYLCAVGPENARRICVFDVAKEVDNFVGWFFWFDIPIKCLAWSDTIYIAGAYSGYCLYERQ